MENKWQITILNKVYFSTLPSRGKAKREAARTYQTEVAANYPIEALVAFSRTESLSRKKPGRKPTYAETTSKT